MSEHVEPALGLLVVALAALLIVALLIASVKIRAGAARRFGIRVYDFAADLQLPPRLHSRGYQFALYLTMKSLPREPIDPSPPVAPAS